MSGDRHRTCVRPGCDDAVVARDHCIPHYQKLRAAGVIDTTRVDPGPVREFIADQLAQGRTVHGLATAAGVDPEGLRKFHLGQRQTLNQATAGRVMQVPQPVAAETTAHQLRALRELGISRREFAERSGIPFGTLQNGTVAAGRFTPALRERIAVGFEQVMTERLFAGQRTDPATAATDGSADRERLLAEYPAGMTGEVNHEHLVALYRTGMSAREVARVTKVSDKTVGRAVEAAGVPTSQPGTRFDRAEIAALHGSGLSAKAVARELGCTDTTVHRALREAGVETRESLTCQGSQAATERKAEPMADQDGAAGRLQDSELAGRESLDDVQHQYYLNDPGYMAAVAEIEDARRDQLVAWHADDNQETNDAAEWAGEDVRYSS